MRTLLTLTLISSLIGCYKPRAVIPALATTRESVIDFLKLPEIRAETAKGSASYQAWAEGQVTGACFVHHAKMHRKWQPVAYGLSIFEDLPTKEESDAKFPFADDGFWPGGCVRTPVTEKEVHVCDQCTAAHAQWKREHPRKRA